MRQTQEKTAEKGEEEVGDVQQDDKAQDITDDSSRPTSNPTHIPLVSASPGLSPTTAPAQGTQTGNVQSEEAATGAKSNGTQGDDAQQRSEDKPIKLYKSSRLKGYLTLVLASVINYDAANKSGDVIMSSGAIPSTDEQRSYALAVAIVSLILTGITTLVHLDTITPLEKVWVAAFKSKSRFELVLAVFLVIWWSVATGIHTSITGIAGDG